MAENNLPLGICKQAIMKYESALADVREIIEDENIQDSDKDDFVYIAEYTGSIIANMYNKVMQEMGEEEFINESVNMDEIDKWPGDCDNVLDECIDK